MSIDNIESIITTYTSAYRRAKFAGDPRAEDYGRRLTYWICQLEQAGGLQDTGTAFQMGRYACQSNVMQVA